MLPTPSSANTPLQSVCASSVVYFLIDGRTVYAFWPSLSTLSSMPPLTINSAQVHRLVGVLADAIDDVAEHESTESVDPLGP